MNTIILEWNKTSLQVSKVSGTEKFLPETKQTKSVKVKKEAVSKKQ